MKRILYSVIITTTIAASVSACAPTTRAPFADPKATAEEQDRQKRAAVQRIVEYRERLNRVGHRVLMAAAPFCKETEMRSDVLVVKPSHFPPELRETAMAMGYKEDANGDGPYQRCKITQNIALDQRINAYSTGPHIVFFTGMIDFAKTDDELAAVWAHESAHSAMGHIEAKRGNAAVGAVVGGIISVLTGVNVVDMGSQIGGSAFSQDFETEADYVGLYIMARAGYSIDSVPDFWMRMGAASPGSITHASSHPTTADRAVRLKAAIEEIKGKQARGEELKPEMAPRQENAKPGETQTGWGKPPV